MGLLPRSSVVHTGVHMTKSTLTLGLFLSFSLCSLAVSSAQEADAIASPVTPQSAPVVSSARSLAQSHGGMIVTPKSSAPSGKQGATLKTMQAHTNLQVFLPAGWKASEATPPRPDELPPYAGYAYETPASLACLYALVPVTPGCNPNTVTTNPSGGKNAIALVDAYDDPWAGPDLAYFSAQFGLPFDASQFEVVYQSGTPPTVDTTGGWELEEALDTEYAHAMAPNAKIYLVEANSNSVSDLLTAVQIASDLVHCGKTTSCPSSSKGAGEVSMSWGAGEFDGETSYDSYFTTPGVVYFASAGDTPGVEWPCASRNVVCAGGTTARRNPYTGDFFAEWSWPSTGGGASDYEPLPPYQDSISSIVGKSRGVPDVSLDADPYTGLWVWSSYLFAIDVAEGDGAASDYGWWIVGGTSAATPTWAGIVNRAGSFAASSHAELTTLYKNKADAADFRDIKMGDCGPYMGWSPVPGWDPCTGIGTAKGYKGK